MNSLDDVTLVAIAAQALRQWTETYGRSDHALVRLTRAEVERRGLGRAVLEAIGGAP